MSTYYEVLGVGPAVTRVELRKAYQARAQECHPDRGGTSAEMADVNVAYEVLSDPTKREVYDRELRARAQSAPQPPPRPQAAPPRGAGQERRWGQRPADDRAPYTPGTPLRPVPSSWTPPTVRRPPLVPLGTRARARYVLAVVVVLAVVAVTRATGEPAWVVTLAVASGAVYLVTLRFRARERRELGGWFFVGVLAGWGVAVAASSSVPGWAQQHDVDLSWAGGYGDLVVALVVFLAVSLFLVSVVEGCREERSRREQQADGRAAALAALVADAYAWYEVQREADEGWFTLCWVAVVWWSSTQTLAWVVDHRGGGHAVTLPGRCSAAIWLLLDLHDPSQVRVRQVTDDSARLAWDQLVAAGL